MSEHLEQVAIFAWAKMSLSRHPCLKYLSGSLTGVKLTIGQAMKAKRAGVIKGYPDIFLPHPCGPYHGLFIELKAGKNKPTKEQVDYLEYLNSVGYLAVVKYGAEESIKTINQYLAREI